MKEEERRRRKGCESGATAHMDMGITFFQDEFKFFVEFCCLFFALLFLIEMSREMRMSFWFLFLFECGVV